MAYYHLILEVRENLGKRDELRDVLWLDIDDIQSIVPTVIIPYLRKNNLTYQDDEVAYDDIQLFEIKQTLLPIQQLVQQKQRDLPSQTDVTITEFEVFNDRELCIDVTQVVCDLLEA